MGDYVRHTARQLPVVIASNPELVLAKAEVYRTPDKVLIQITSEAANGQILAEFLEQEASIGLMFSAVPSVRRI
jgi:hypothetical protein